MSDNKSSSSLSEFRKKSNNNNFLDWLKKHCPYLFNIDSLFYYFWFIVLIGFLWTLVSLLSNNFTALLGWDYTWQYVPAAYYTHDVWWTFLTTGHFDLYSSNTFLGTDNIGSNAYYGLFDPFNIFVVLAPRSWVPQMMAIAAFFKGAVGAMLMYAFLKYRGCKEWTSRVGGAAFAFNGFFTFMSGFPTVVSSIVFLPLVLLGIEKVLKEKKPYLLALGLYFTGIANFFYLVVFCVFGVCYAIWRYFVTLKTRKGLDHLYVILIGVFAFAVGLMLCSYVLIPSLRESALSGRTTSIGQAYLATILEAFSSFDLGLAFSTIFSMVGENPGRELMGLISFFYPTTGYLYLPLAVPVSSALSTATQYDAWTASLFCYTPMLIMFIYGIIGGIRRKDFVRLGGFSLCVVALFTTFSYYFFYLFTGDGYGRWLIVLVPLIILVACQELDLIKENPKWQLLSATGISIVMSVITIIICVVVLENQSFTSPNNLTYYPHYFADIGGNTTIYIVIYQLVILVIECLTFYFLANKAVLPKVLLVFIAIESAVAGNMCFFYGSSWSYEQYFQGGSANFSAMNTAATYINENDDSFYRVYTDYYNNKNDGMTYHLNMDSHFHSLYNFDVGQFARMMGLVTNDGTYTETYGGHMYGSKNWSANYNNKDFGYDTVTGHKYYVIKNEGYGTWNDEDYMAINVPFDSELVYKNENFAIYKSGLHLELGHAVDTLYQEHEIESDTTPNLTAFYGGTPSALTILRNENLFLDAAVIEDEDVERLPDGFSIANPNATDPLPTSGSYGYTTLRTTCYYYVTTSSETVSEGQEVFGGFNASNPGGFLNPLTQDLYLDRTVSVNPSVVTSAIDMKEDDGKLVFAPSDGSTYFNTSDGAYIEMYFSKTSSGANRVYLIGDYVDEDGVSHEYALLNYEYQSIRSCHNNYSYGMNQNFGLYANGKVRYIVVCPKSNWGDVSRAIAPSNFAFYMKEKDAIMDQIERYRSSEYALNDVVYVNADTFTFNTNFSSEKMVVTQIGYDSGWSIVARDKDGNVLSGVETYKLDGGLVGFNALEGEVYYTLSYMTPYLEFSVALAIIGTTLLIGFFMMTTYIEYRKIKSLKA